MTDTAPTIVNRTLPKRLPNSAYRVREYLTEKEVDRLIEAARKRGRNGARDAAAILLATGVRSTLFSGRTASS
jgi:type 1 fimbriae regulatory protein FimE